MSASRTIVPPSNSNGSSPKKPTSQKKIEANRRNAQRSTGPKTAMGKRAVSRNALKHGLLAREVVITGGDGKENDEDFETLVNGLWAHYEPVGIVEEMLVEKVATCWWRLARVLRAETGEIRKRLDSVGQDYSLNERNKFSLNSLWLDLYRAGILYSATNEADKKISTEERMLNIHKLQSNQRESTLGAASLYLVLTDIRRDLTEKGEISESTLDWLKFTNAVCDYPLVAACVSLEGERSNEECGDKRDRKAIKAVLELIDHRLRMLEGTLKQSVGNLISGALAERQIRTLPSADAADRILRYESHLERQLDRAIDQLERLQRRRGGESVPPPLNVNLARRT
jgi:hypothetical protein